MDQTVYRPIAGFASPALLDRRRMLHKIVRKELDVAFSVTILP
jgi:hypothetical protein